MLRRLAARAPSLTIPLRPLIRAAEASLAYNVPIAMRHAAANCVGLARAAEKEGPLAMAGPYLRAAAPLTPSVIACAYCLGCRVPWI